MTDMCTSDSAHLVPGDSMEAALAKRSDIRQNQQDNDVIRDDNDIHKPKYPAVAGQTRFLDYHFDLNEILPQELWELILSFCDEKQLAIRIPIICKYFYHLCTEDCAVWKEKSISKFKLTVEEILSLDSTWKRFYHCNTMKLFPLFGCTIGKSTLEEFQKAPKVKLHSNTFLSLDRMSCWLENGVFSELYLIRSINRIPENWESAVGISWHKSFNEYRTLMRRWTGNYIATYQRTHQGEYFVAKISSISKEVNVFYEISFEFGPVRG